MPTLIRGARRLLFSSRSRTSLPEQPPTDHQQWTGLSRFLSLRVRSKSYLIHVVEHLADDADAPIVLALPFTGGHSRNLRPFCEELCTRGFHAIAIDYPGHGRSSGERGSFQLEELFAAIEAVVNEYANRFPGSSIALAGSSWGGDLAILFALWEQHLFAQQLRTRRVSAVVGQAVITPWNRPVFAGFRAGISLLFSRQGMAYEILKRALGPRLSLSRMYRVKDLYSNKGMRNRFAADPLALRSYETSDYLDYLTYLPRADYSDLEIPVHLVIGEQDQIVPFKYEQQVYESLKSMHEATTLNVLAGEGHGIFEEQTTELADIISELLTPLKQSGDRIEFLDQPA